MTLAEPNRVDAPGLPRVVTTLPGPRSLEVQAAEAALTSGGHSAGADWAGLAIDRGIGAMVRDVDGNWLLDACSGTVVMNIGHGHPQVAAALAEQASRLTHFYDFPASERVDFLTRLRSTMPEGLDTFLMTNSGAEAVEASVRMARSATGRHEVVAFHNGYHGRTLGALSLTAGSGREGLGPLLPGVWHAPSAYCHRCPLDKTYPECEIACLRGLEDLQRNVATQPPAAVIVEPMQGAGGMIPMPHEFLEKLRTFCDRTGAILIFDEILTGAGRTGKFWALEHSGVVPDMLLLGKGLGGGYPIGVVAGRRELMDSGPVAKPTHNSSTFGGGQLACAAGSAALRILEEEELIERGARAGTRVLAGLQNGLKDVHLVSDVRGLGLAIGVEMVNGEGSPAASEISRELLRRLRDAGVLISSSSHVLRVTPPLCISDEQVDFLVDAVCAALCEIDGSRQGY